MEQIIPLIKGKIKGEGNIIVAIAGGSASGKTKIARDIRSFFSEKPVILSIDDYYRSKEFREEERKRGNYINLDQPESTNIDLFKSHLQLLKENKAIRKPVYSMIGEENREEDLSPSKVIISEGLFTLNEKLKDEADVKIFVEANTRSRLIRRVVRDVMERKRDPSEVIEYFFKVVEPMHQKYVESTKKYADVIISNEYNEEVEGEDMEENLSTILGNIRVPTK